jgi:hydrogenase large subunit
MPDIFLPFITKGPEHKPQPTQTPSPTATSTPSPTPTSTPGPSPTPTATSTPGPGQKIVIDPLTRIEGHLRIEAQVENGYVTDAWSSSTMFRGIETILKGRDPRDAWIITQRLCGVCTTVHAICSVRAVENALGITVPDNARIIRNLLEGIQFVQDHVIHFYHLHALDWVDIVSALSADPAATSALAQSISDWPNSSPDYFSTVKARLQTFVNSGQLGLFANAYWGHPVYKLPPEGNLLAVAHYLEALDWQREVIKMHAILGGKNPHPQTYLVGGMAVPVDPTSSKAINPSKIAQLRALATQALNFVSKVYLPDLQLVASFYKDWASLGAGVGNYLSFGDFPTDTSGSPSALWLQQGAIFDKNISAPPQPLDQNQIQEFVTHSWFSYAGGNNVGLHPWQGETQPNYTGPQPPYDFLNTDDKYTWLKAPRYNGAPMEVGPLSRMLVAYAAGHARVQQLVNDLLLNLGVGAQALFSTLGRVAARGVETMVIAEKMLDWITALEANMNNGNLAIHNNYRWDPAAWPAEATGWGATESPRGALGHWVHIKNGKIENYQMVVATTWNGSPRDAAGQRGAWEEALVGTPVADPARPVEILRTVHSFDPCMACSVHVVDSGGRQVTQIKVV